MVSFSQMITFHSVQVCIDDLQTCTKHAIYKTIAVPIIESAVYHSLWLYFVISLYYVMQTRLFLATGDILL